MANIKVRLKDASKNVLHPETDWSVIQNKPSIFPADWKSSVLNKPFDIVKNDSNRDVLRISGFDYFVFEKLTDTGKISSFSFGCCDYYNGNTHFYFPAFYSKEWGNGGYVKQKYYRYNYTQETWETFVPDNNENKYYPFIGQ